MTLYLIFNFDAGIFTSPYLERHHANFQWARDALEANSLRNPDWWLSTQVTTPARLTDQSINLWYPFLTPTPNRIDLFVYETEREDMVRRVGSGQTMITATLCLPPQLLDDWRREVARLNRKWDPRLVWCLGLPCDPFILPPSRTVPNHRPIGDSWVTHLAVDRAELTFVQLDLELDNNWPADLPDCKKTMLHSSTLRASIE
jgi:hypothetical protein